MLIEGWWKLNKVLFRIGAHMPGFEDFCSLCLCLPLCLHFPGLSSANPFILLNEWSVLFPQTTVHIPTTAFVQIIKPPSQPEPLLLCLCFVGASFFFKGTKSSSRNPSRGISPLCKISVCTLGYWQHWLRLSRAASCLFGQLFYRLYGPQDCLFYLCMPGSRTGPANMLGAQSLFTTVDKDSEIIVFFDEK